jgi:hypothetical protein
MSTNPLTAMIALRTGGPGVLAEALQTLRRQWPDAKVTADNESGRDVVTLAVDGHAAAVYSVDEPLPWDAVERAVAAAAWYWPQAAAALREHTAKLVAAVLPQSGDQVGAARALTGLTAELAGLDAAAGVFWVAAGLVHEPAAFRQYSREMDEEYLPLYLWIDFAVMPTPDGQCSLWTTGLEALGHLEIEVQRSHRRPEELIERAFNVAHYLLDKGPVLKPGQTVGLSQEEQIQVLHSPSMRDESRTVIQLEL